MVKILGNLPFEHPKDLLELVRSMDLQVLKNWDDDTVKCCVHKVIQSEPILIEVCYSIHTAPYPLAQREFVTVRAYKTLPDGTHIQVQTSINNKEFRTDPSVVRGVNVLSGWRARPIEGKLHVSRITSIDPKGSIPYWVVALYKTKAAKNIEGMRGYLHKLNVK